MTFLLNWLNVWKMVGGFLGAKRPIFGLDFLKKLDRPAELCAETNWRFS
jgi:hypothetical protein